MTVTSTAAIMGIISITITIVITIMTAGGVADISGERRDHCQSSTFKTGPDEQVLKLHLLFIVVFSPRLDDRAESGDDQPAF
jgi:hypothetical protein